MNKSSWMWKEILDAHTQRSSRKSIMRNTRGENPSLMANCPMGNIVTELLFSNSLFLLLLSTEISLTWTLRSCPQAIKCPFLVESISFGTKSCEIHVLIHYVRTSHLKPQKIVLFFFSSWSPHVLTENKNADSINLYIVIVQYILCNCNFKILCGSVNRGNSVRVATNVLLCQKLFIKMTVFTNIYTVYDFPLPQSGIEFHTSCCS